MAIDPVCGMEVDESSAPARATCRGKDYYFCTPLCREWFDENPPAYAGDEETLGMLRNLFRSR